MPNTKNSLPETFTDSVKRIVREIPKGEVRTYKDIAGAAKNPRAARAVANIMAANYDPTVPCHRVIRTDGTLGGYNRGGTAAKRAILASEGVVI